MARIRSDVRASLATQLGLVLLLCVVVSVMGCSSGPRGRAADIAWLATRLPKLHKNLFFELSETEYRQALDDVAARAAELSDEEFYVALAQVVARIGDGHTNVFVPYATRVDIGQYPMELYWFADGVYVMGATAGLAQSVGCRLVAIDGMPIDEVLELAASLVPQENDVSVLVRVPPMLVRPEVLYGLGVTEQKDRACFTFEMADGTQSEMECRAATSIYWTAGQSSAPMWWGNSAVIWHRYLAAERTLYIQYNSCQGDLSQATREIAAVLDSEPVDRIVFDMRRNGGGNSEVAKGLIGTLAARPEVREPGHMFVLVGRSTYSSAILNSYDFRQRTNAIFIGEPTAGKPNCYGEVKSATLPHSKLLVGYSIKYFEMVRGEDPPSFMPDIVVMQTAKAFFAGRDPVLETAVGYEHGGGK